MPSVLGLVIMNTAVWSSSLAARSSRSTKPPGVLLIVTASKPARLRWPGLVPWALSGTSTLVRLLAAIAKIGRRDQQRRQLALRPGGRLQRYGRQPGDLGQHLLQVVKQFEQALERLSG